MIFLSYRKNVFFTTLIYLNLTYNVLTLDFNTWINEYGSEVILSPTSLTINYVPPVGSEIASPVAQNSGTYCLQVAPPLTSGVVLSMRLTTPGITASQYQMETAWLYPLSSAKKPSVQLNLWGSVANNNLVTNNNVRLPGKLNAKYCMTWSVGGSAMWYVDGQLVLSQSMVTFSQPLVPSIVTYGGMLNSWFVQTAGAYTAGPYAITTAKVSSAYLSTVQEPIPGGNTPVPTSEPTITPPTFPPTAEPSFPTINPSFSPSIIPSSSPSFKPTFAPVLFAPSSSQDSTVSVPDASPSLSLPVILIWVGVGVALVAGIYFVYRMNRRNSITYNNNEFSSKSDKRFLMDSSSAYFYPDKNNINWTNNMLSNRQNFNTSQLEVDSPHSTHPPSCTQPETPDTGPGAHAVRRTRSMSPTQSMSRTKTPTSAPTQQEIAQSELQWRPSQLNVSNQQQNLKIGGEIQQPTLPTHTDPHRPQKIGQQHNSDLCNDHHQQQHENHRPPATEVPYRCSETRPPIQMESQENLYALSTQQLLRKCSIGTTTFFTSPINRHSSQSLFNSNPDDLQDMSALDVDNESPGRVLALAKRAVPIVPLPASISAIGSPLSSGYLPMPSANLLSYDNVAATQPIDHSKSHHEITATAAVPASALTFSFASAQISAPAPTNAVSPVTCNPSSLSASAEVPASSELVFPIEASTISETSPMPQLPPTSRAAPKTPPPPPKKASVMPRQQSPINKQEGAEAQPFAYRRALFGATVNSSFKAQLKKSHQGVEETIKTTSDNLSKL